MTNKKLNKVPVTCCRLSKPYDNPNIGDQVHINSGSPVLTVVDFFCESNHIAPLIVVSWKVNNQELEAIFPKQLLHKINN